MSEIRFDGQVAIVTGAGGGVGRCHALELARRGAKVVVNDLGGALDGSGGNSEAAEKVVEEIKALGGEAIANGSSVADDAGVEKMIADTMSAFGRIDIIIANAGVLRDKSFSKMTIEDFEFVMDVHLMGTVKPVKAAWEIMKEQNYGRIVVTTSSTGLYGNFGQTNYGAAKLGLVGFMGSLKQEGAKYNIRVNAVCPIAATRMTEGLMTEQALAALKPEYVTPGVMNLVKEDAPTGMILSAAAGAYSMAQIVETKGAFVGLGDDLTAEAVAAKWDEITDTSVQKHFDMGAGHGANIFERVNEALGIDGPTITR
ncbi:MAG: SDR family NAD(P)-dependent oxidoreductase [Pseudomonadota bacterium]